MCIALYKCIGIPYYIMMKIRDKESFFFYNTFKLLFPGGSFNPPNYPLQR